jgi:hypothetical protein
MNTIEELAALRRRIGGVEHELEQLKRRVVLIEQATASSQPPMAPQTSGAAALAAMMPPVATSASGRPLTGEVIEAQREVAPPPIPQPPPLPKAPGFAPVATAGSPVFRRAPAPSFLDTIRPWLERAQLWPPSGEASREVQLGAWWATRLGILFAVIGAVFFGVYVSLNTPPWVKFTELLGASLGIAALGLRLERKTPRFGQVIFAGGLALVFFATMAAYTVPGVKVLESRFAAGLWQVLVTAGIGAVAWRRNSQPVATLAALLGYVAVWFSFSGGFELFALTSAIGYAMLTVVWRRCLGWEAPSVAALAGYWIIYGTLLLGLDGTERALLPGWSWGFVLGGYAAFFWRDDKAGRTKTDVDAREIWVQNANSSAALALGWLTAWLAFPERMGGFYAIAGVVLGLAAWRRALTVAGDVVSAVLVAKALGALTLAVIKWTDPSLTALALLVQAGVLLVTTRRLRSRVMANGSALVTTVSLGYWLEDTLGVSVAAASLTALGRVVYLTGFMAWGLEMARSCGADVAEQSRRAVRRVVSTTGAVLAVVTAMLAMPVAWQPSWLVATATVLGAAGFFWKQRASWVAAGVVGLVAHVSLWSRLHVAALFPTEIWGNACVVLAPTVAGAWWLGREGGTAKSRVAWWASALTLMTLGACVYTGYGASASLLAGLVLAAALAIAAPWQPARRWLWLSTWALGVSAVGHAMASLGGRGVERVEGVRWFAALGLQIGVAGLMAWPRGRAQLARESPRGGTQWLTMGFAVVFGVAVTIGREDAAEGLLALSGFALLAEGLLTWVWVEALRGAAWLFSLLAAAVLLMTRSAPMTSEGVLLVGGSWVPALLWAKSARIRERWTRAGGDVDGTVRAQTWLAGSVTAVAIGTLSGDGQRVGWFAAAAAVAAVLARMTFSASVEVATGLALAGLAYGVGLVGADGAVDTGQNFAAVAAMAALAVAMPLILPPGRIWARPGGRAFRDWLFPSAGLALLFALMLSQRGLLEPYVTVGWAVAALAWFGVGLFGRLRPARLLGLAGLTLCVPRMFLVDLNSTLYRIAAFCALGVVLLWVGFSYHRFRHLIVGDAKTDGPKNDAKKES